MALIDAASLSLKRCTLAWCEVFEEPAELSLGSSLSLAFLKVS